MSERTVLDNPDLAWRKRPAPIGSVICVGASACTLAEGMFLSCSSLRSASATAAVKRLAEALLLMTASCRLAKARRLIAEIVVALMTSMAA
jgi:hypothetical protein